MQTINVLKTDDVSTIANGTFIYCKELRKGFLKTDLTPLNLSSTKFESVVSVIESMGVGLVNTDYDSILFGANLSPNQGEIEKSYRLEETIKEIASNLSSTERQTWIDSMKLKSRYFDEENILILHNIKYMRLTNIYCPKSYKMFALKLSIGGQNLEHDNTNWFEQGGDQYYNSPTYSNYFGVHESQMTGELASGAFAGGSTLITLNNSMPTTRDGININHVAGAFWESNQVINQFDLELLDEDMNVVFSKEYRNLDDRSSATDETTTAWWWTDSPLMQMDYVYTPN